MEELLLKSQKETIKKLEELIQQVRNGEIIEFTCAYVMPDDRRNWWNSSMSNKWATAGHLMDIATTILQAGKK